MDITIRVEQPDDADALDAVHEDAFGRADEAELVKRLRAADAIWLSQVAEVDGKLRGHALYSMVTVTDGDNVYHFPALGPLAVSKTNQNQGVGSALMQAGIQTARDAGYSLMFLVGHPDYYARFGFQPAQPLGFTSDYVEEDGPHEHFMVRMLEDDEFPTGVRGHVRYHEAFEGV